ncbi:cyclase family protein [Roseococcus microcysteis]|uniref:cyclase family protein n=1 Tax=Roseococcus microcysteis TaxID=2771361 RepID=UPI00168ACE5F|nr:cyclase family protein [Roseococcus microcysteis]
MKLIDLSRTITHKMQRLVNHPTIEVYPFSTHDEKRVVDGYEFSSATMVLHMGDHGGTHVDAPVHFDARPGAKTIDEMPLETFFTEAVCLDLTHVPDRTDITIAHLEAAERAAGVEIRKGDTVLLYTGFYARAAGTEGYITDFPGLTKESATWLGEKGITAFTVESVSPGRPGRNNFEVHHVCRDMGFTHYEGVVNLDKVVGKGRFRFIALPLKIAGGTGSPVRACAILEG